jgi:hypothetical protein
MPAEAEVGPEVGVAVLGKAALVAVLKADQPLAMSAHLATLVHPMVIIPKGGEMAAPAVSKAPAEAAGPVAALAVRLQNL